MKKILSVIVLFLVQNVFSQVSNQEKKPAFPSCVNSDANEAEKCFYNQLYDHVFVNFKVPEKERQNNFKGNVITLFEVDSTGTFKVLYVDAIDQELIEETKRVFAILPVISPATFNGKPTYAKYTLTFSIPLKSAAQIAEEAKKQETIRVSSLSNDVNKENPEYDAIEKNYQDFKNPQFSSHLNIPFSHHLYSQFDDEMNQLGTNSHTASKPFTYDEVVKYYNFEKEFNAIKKNTTSWLSRKLFNENLVQIQGKEYWFTMNPVLDLQVGKSKSTSNEATFVNTRAIQIQGGLGKQFNFTTTIYETQGYFAEYYNRFARLLKPAGGDPAIVPGIGIAKDFNVIKFDIPSADANISYTPSKVFNFQIGYSRNFIGDGYRSLLEGDGASPYPFFKINTTFWKIKYTNTYMLLKDVRPEVTFERTYTTKYMANHYLSWNASKRLTIGFFESVVWANSNGRGFDPNFLNPVIFYRSVEFSSSARSGNALLGLTGKYKCNNKLNFYGQFLIDEFSFGDVQAGNKSWRNKFGFQIGGKYYHAFGVKNLYLQGEYNHIRPYVYSHSSALTNYGHNNQSMGHNWGSNVDELVGIARYARGRIYGEFKLNIGIRGYDFDTASDDKNYGSNIYKSYEDNRYADTGVVVGQGNKTTILIADLQAGYLLNPSTNMKIFGNLSYRNFSPAVDTATTFKENTTWFSVGLRSDLFNWYFDY
jgi:hypothetical protein